MLDKIIKIVGFVIVAYFSIVLMHFGIHLFGFFAKIIGTVVVLGIVGYLYFGRK